MIFSDRARQIPDSTKPGFSVFVCTFWFSLRKIQPNSCTKCLWNCEIRFFPTRPNYEQCLFKIRSKITPTQSSYCTLPKMGTRHRCSKYKWNGRYEILNIKTGSTPVSCEIIKPRFLFLLGLGILLSNFAC